MCPTALYNTWHLDNSSAVLLLSVDQGCLPGRHKLCYGKRGLQKTSHPGMPVLGLGLYDNIQFQSRLSIKWTISHLADTECGSQKDS